VALPVLRLAPPAVAMAFLGVIFAGTLLAGMTVIALGGVLLPLPVAFVVTGATVVPYLTCDRHRPGAAGAARGARPVSAVIAACYVRNR
jgi:hypothetical protein